MDFVGKIVGKVIESKLGGGSQSQEQQQQQQPDYGYSDPGYGSGPPPPPPSGGQDLPYPWVARWDDGSGRYYYVNEQTGETSWMHPGGGGGAPYGGSGYGGQPSYGEQPYGQPYGQPGYGYGQDAPRQEYYGEEQPKKDHSMAYGAAGAAAGMLGGGLLAHEGDNICMHSLSFPCVWGPVVTDLLSR